MVRNKNLPAKGYRNLNIKTEVVDSAQVVIDQDNKGNRVLDFNSVPDLVSSFLKSFALNPIPKYQLMTLKSDVDDLRNDIEIITKNYNDVLNRLGRFNTRMHKLEKKL